MNNSIFFEKDKPVVIYLSLERLSQEYIWDSLLVGFPLARVTPVIFFEPPWEAISVLLKDFWRSSDRRRREKVVLSRRRIPENMVVKRLYSLLPWGLTNPLAAKINRMFVLLQIKWHARKYPAQSRILLTYWRDSADMIKKIKAAVRIHHCQDEIAGFPWPSEKARVRAKVEEEKVARTVDFILVTSPTLVEPMSKHNENVKVLANDVVDFEFFNRGLSMSPPGELRDTARPIVGFVGGLSKFKQDYQLLEYVATELPDWSFVLVGPCRVDLSGFHELPQRENILYLGSRLHEDIPRYVAVFDVCIIPNQSNLYNQHSFPMKLFEYLALGKPIVATDMPTLRPYEKYVHIARDAEQFVIQLKRAYREDSEEKRKGRVRFAAAHGWDKRGPKILRLLMSCIREIEERLENR